MLSYLIFSFLFYTLITAKSIDPHITVQEYGKRFHPPLVRNIRSLEDELRDLSLENEFYSRSNEDRSSDQDEDHSKDLESLTTVSIFKPENILDQFSSPAATEYMVTSTATPQLTNDHAWPVVTESPPKEESDEEDDEDDDDDDDDDEDDDDEEEEDEENATPKLEDGSWHFIESSTEAPANEPEESLKNETSGQKELVGDQNDENEVPHPSARSSAPRTSENWTMDEVLAKLSEIGIDDVKLMSKKGGGGKNTKENGKKSKGTDEMTNEDIMEIIVKVAEDPKDWEQIRQLLEKIEYEGATLKKAKSRLRALARQKQIKLRKGGGKLKWPKATASENSVLSKGHENLSNHLEGRAPYDPSTKTRVLPLESRGQSEGGSYIKVSVFPTAPVKTNGKHSKQHQHHHHRHPSQTQDVDYAIEQPVTVIGERSRIDPVEKELLEASTNQRIREIQKEKARLEAISNPTDDMEGQLKAVSKMERRLKEHWSQKQKLLQKIREKNEKESAEQEQW